MKYTYPEPKFTVDRTGDLPKDAIPGDYAIVGGYFIRYIFILCPKCGNGRWVTLQQTRKPGHTGMCTQCYTFIAKNNMAKLRKDIMEGKC